MQTVEEKKIIEDSFKELLKVCIRCDKPGDKEMITHAFEIAKEAHQHMRRRSGEPYVLHPLEVAKIVTREIGLGAKSMTCAMLHDVVEDTDYEIEDIRNIFGEKIAYIIDGLTKISDVFDRDSSLQAENFRKMLLTLSDDVRVILIKLADRLHNMRTLSSMPPNKQLKIAGETLYLYAPLAHRLGLYAIKTELEDLSFKYRHPQIYEELLRKIKENEKHRLHKINRFTLPIAQRLTDEGLKFRLTGRPKSIYSIWNKMQTKNVAFEEVYDLLAIRIIFTPQNGVSEKNQCWNIYSLITDIYKPNPNRIRDWVSTPKANGYEALHSTVMGPGGEWVEIQIRSERMDEIAERGFAAHYKYKNVKSEESELDKWIKKIRELLEDPQSDALEFIDDFKLNLFSSEILVFTPKGHIKTLPKGATTLDFAYDIHTEVGKHCIGAKVNHKLVGLSYVLNSGDQVEILTSEKKNPEPEWINFVITARAKAAIKNGFKIERKKYIKEGKNKLEERLKEIKLYPNSKIIKKIFDQYEINNKDDLYYQIGNSSIDVEEIVKLIKKRTRNKLIRYWRLQFSKGTSEKKKGEIIKTKNLDKKTTFLVDESAGIIIAKCCNPIPGDDVLGYLNPDNTITIHKTKCPTAIKLNSSFGERMVKAEWKAQKILSYLVKIKLNGIDDVGVLKKITTIISEQLDVNMRAINFVSYDGVFEGTIEIYVHNTNDLNNLILELMKVKGILSVNRIENPIE
ncbi:MAG: bifunctional (p)ppGpp synthetase/guanosine-3',5'-bis(diphosphate) 3'-pyrophosphohydrolase [Chlorobi bacterium]|nr:bifunctional (p)ppGpp synthetase/guanosine-3',5'-bis(diphosphate) 3'-pyrophosphohydrolase [Chlorobiota bacterium]